MLHESLAEGLEGAEICIGGALMSISPDQPCLGVSGEGRAFLYAHPPMDKFQGSQVTDVSRIFWEVTTLLPSLRGCC